MNIMAKQKSYIAIDLKSFYASVECVQRGLNPLTTNLVVADTSRTEKTICLAVSPSLKTFGIGGRSRLFEVVQRVKEANRKRQLNTPNRRLTGKSHNFEELAVMFEGSTASGAERAYRRAVDKLTEFLVAEGAIHAVRLKQKSKTKRKKKIATAIYEYQADCDGEWGEISLDFENGTAEIIRLADWDTMKTNRFANKAIVYLLNCENEKLPKETIVAAEL